ncbi:MAG: DUF6644 family protein [Bryobacteraceae bacterium]
MSLDSLLDSELAFPVFECFHIAGFAVAIGTVALADFRLLGFGLRKQTASEITKSTWVVTLIGLLTAIFSGMLMYITDPDKYYLNWSFLIKVACLILAIVFHYTVHRKVVHSDTTTGGSKAVAVLSLALWASVVFGGIFIAFVLPGL